MSRLFDALQRARPDITERFEPGSGPQPVSLPSRYSGRHDEQFLALVEKLERTQSAHHGRCVGFVGVSGGEGTTTIVREFADFIGTRLHAPVVALTVAPAAGEDSQSRLEDVLEPASELRGHRYATATLVMTNLPNASVSEIEALLAPLAQRFGWVVLDCPPMLGGAGCKQLYSVLDQLVIVAEAGRSHSRDLTRAARVAQAAGGNVAGMILNKRANKIPAFLRSVLQRLHLA